MFKESKNTVHTIRQALHQKVNTTIRDTRFQLAATLRSDATVFSVALVFALGTFINLLPIPGADMVLGFSIVKLIRPILRAPILAAMTIWNGFLTTPLLASSGKIGLWLDSYLNIQLIGQSERALLLQQFLIGNLTMALTVSTVCFIAVFVILGCYRFSRVSAARTMIPQPLSAKILS